MDAIRRALGWARARWACSRAMRQRSRSVQADSELRASLRDFQRGRAAARRSAGLSRREERALIRRAVAQEYRTLFPIQNDREERYARLRGWLPSDA